MDIRLCTAEDITHYQAQWIELLADSVNHGASVGFLAPLDTTVAAEYWAGVAYSVSEGDKLLWAAWDGEQIAGSIQLELCQKPNGIHRAEVQKLLVHTRYRRQGLATRLLDALEAGAHSRQRRLLVLDTEQGSAAETLYEKYGYQRGGVIPYYAATNDGTDFIATVLFYRWLGG